MNQDLQEERRLLMDLAAADPEYLRRMQLLAVEERRLDLLEPDMTEEQRSAVWDFIDACWDVEQRLLELALELTE